MRINNFTIWLLTGILLINISCEEDVDNSVINVHDYYGDGSFFVSFPKLNSPEIILDHCGMPTTYEMRKLAFNLQEFGTVTIFRDGLYLNFQFDLVQDRISEGWRIYNTYVWVGLSEEWREGRDGVEGGWDSLEGIDINRFPTNPTSGIHQIRLEDWMIENCFTVAVRILTIDQDENLAASDSFINNGDYLTYSWNEPYCLQKCNDPGTLNVNYWENNPDVWTQGVSVGGVFYSEELAIQIMKGITTTEDMSNMLFEELVSAKLNVDLGNTSYCIVEAIATADTWMEENGPVGNGILLGNPAWDTGNSLANQLKNYNNGLMCADPAN